MLLLQETAHHKGIRAGAVLSQDCFVTGDFEGRLLVWRRQGARFEVAATLTIHAPNFIFALVGRDDRTFFSADNKGRIYLCSTDGSVLAMLAGHDQAVGSLDFRDGVLVSGSWDSTARVWREDGELLHELQGHSFGVSVCVMSSSPLIVVTGSQDGALLVWLQGGLVHTCRAAHTDLIRRVVRIDGSTFATCSNDQSVAIWSLNGSMQIEPVNRLVDHNAFVYDLDIQRGEQLQLVSASEDCSAQVWSLDGKVLHHLPGRKSLWVSRFLNEEELLIAGESGHVTLLSLLPCEGSEAEGQTLLYESECQEARKESRRPVDVKSLPTEDKRFTMRGTKAGQHAMFQRGDIAVVYIWNQNTWEFVGEVVTGQEDSAIIGHSGQTYEGDDTFPPGIYDFVFQVEIRDGAPLAPLPYRRTENPLTVAERFCLRENLSRANIQQIVEFIKNNADLPEPSALREPQRAEPVSVHFPIAEIVTFKSTKNVHVAFEKLAEFAAEHGDDAWTDLELEYLETMRRSITDSGRRLRMVEIELMKAMKPLRWPHNQRLPFLDVWRMFLLHPSSTALFKGPDDGWKYTAVFVGIARDTAYPIAARQMALRVLSNLAASPTSRRALCFKFSYIARDLLGLPSEMMPTLGALLLNYAVSVPQFSAEVDAAAVISLLREVAAHGPSEYLALTTLGTLLCASKAARSGDCAWARSTKAEGREAECASDVQAFLDHF